MNRTAISTSSGEEEDPGGIDSELIIAEVLRDCHDAIVDLMNPKELLDQFEELRLFGEVTTRTVRDLKERLEKGTTSDTNRDLHARLLADPDKYVPVKLCLARAGQYLLLDELEKAESQVHNRKLGDGYSCSCSGEGKCSILESLKCPKNSGSSIPHSVRALQLSLIQFYEEKCQSVPVYASIPEVTEHVANLYVTPNMQEVDIRGCDLGLNSQSCRKTRAEDLKVMCYRDIFYKDGKPCRNIYITGEAGIGKSSFCENLVNQWCIAHACSRSRVEGEKSDDEKVMVEFPLLFFISLRHATEDTDIEAMTCSQLPVKDVLPLLESQKCLVVLDGLDEWISHEQLKGTKYVSKGLPLRSLKGVYTVLTSSRPWKLEVLRLKENEIDKQIQINGLSELSAVELTRRVLSVLNASQCGDKHEDDFLAAMRKNGLNEYLKTPVLLSQMVCLWFYDEPFGDSECDIYCNIIDKQIELATQQKDLPLYSKESLVCQVPYCFSNKANCMNYYKTMLALSRVAFHTLFHENRESSLVFNHRDTELHGMSPTDVEICLKIGLLTQSKVFINFVKKCKKISFLHKTHHEFFAALFIATLDQAGLQHHIMSNSRIRLDDFLEAYKVLLFVNGMNDDSGNSLLQRMLDLAVDDERICKYRTSCIGPCDKNYPLVYRVQAITILCERQRSRSSLSARHISLNDVVCMNKSQTYRLVEHWNSLRPRSARSVSLQTVAGDAKDRHLSTMINKIVECAETSDNLEKVYIWDNGRFITATQVYRAVTSARPTLTCLVLCYINVVSLGETFWDLLTLPSLTTLGLGDHLFLTHEQIQLVSKFLASENKLQELRLKKFRCNSRPHECKIEFDIPRNKTLQRLFVAGQVDKILIDTNNLSLLEARFITVPGITKDLLMCLKTSQNLSEIDLQCDDIIDKQAIVEILPYLACVKQVRLQSMDFGGLALRFPHSMRCLEFVELRNMTIDNSCLKRVLQELPVQRVEIWMGGLNIVLDDEGEFVKDVIRNSPKFEVTLDDTIWMYFHTNV